MKPAVRHRLLRSLTLTRYTDLTITDPEALEQQLCRIAEDGVGYDTGEYLDGLVSLSVPVIGADNLMCFAIAIHAPSARKSLSELRQYLPSLRHAAARMSASECNDREEDAA